MEAKIALIFLISYFVILVLLVAAIVWLFTTIRKHNANHQATLQLNKEQHEHQLLLATIETQEQAFGNIARELHDNVGQKLSYIKMELAKNDRPISEHIITHSINSITDCLEDIRGLARSLNGEYMLANGLIKAIEDFINNTNAIGKTACTFTIDGEAIFLDNNVEIFLYRVVQEAFNNIIKHAKATTASLRFIFTTGQLQIFIVDDGIGFTPAPSRSTGLLNMQSRIQLLQGTCAIQSAPGTGTTIHISLPIIPLTHA
jgi:two-component system, NarL family, sensor kinase